MENNEVVSKKKISAGIVTDLPAEKELYNVAEILVKLRYNTKRWEDIYGADARDRKKAWERKADKWIDDHVKEKSL